MAELDPRFPLIRSRIVREHQERFASLASDIVDDAYREQAIRAARWSPALTTALADVGTATVAEIGPRVVAALGAAAGVWSLAATRRYILAMAGTTAASSLVRADARISLDDLLPSLEAAREELETAPLAGMVASSANFAAHDAGEVGGATHKRWQTNSPSPRWSHAALNGSEVGMKDHFANGLRFPGSGGPPEEIVNCLCSIVLVTKGGG